MRILLVDDNQYALEALTTLLQLKGHEVCPAMTVREALGLAQRKRCDLLIADLGLPDGTAMDLMRELRSMYPLSGIVLSGHDEEEYRAQSRAAGFSRYLVKPIRFTALEAAIAGIGTAERQRLA